MSLNIIVLAKQVPDTRNVGKDAMKEDGTINRAALPAIFNPEDLNALEQALRLKDANPGSTVTVLTMGLPRASEVIREAVSRRRRRRSSHRQSSWRSRYTRYLLLPCPGRKENGQLRCHSRRPSGHRR